MGWNFCSHNQVELISMWTSQECLQLLQTSLNNLDGPWVDFTSRTLIATSYPSSSLPQYTCPNPPFPIIVLKLPLATVTSASE